MSTSARTKTKFGLKQRWKNFRKKNAALLKSLGFYSLHSLHGLLMIIILFAWTSLGFTLSLEGKFLNWQSLFRHHTFMDRLYSPELHARNFIWVDVSGNFTPVTDPESGRTTVITDRELLDSLFVQLANINKHRFVICDLDFDLTSDQDSHLSATLSKIERIAFPHPPGRAGQVNPAFSKLPGGKVNYHITSDWWYLAEELHRFELIGRDGQRSLPLYAYEQIAQTKVIGSAWFLRYQNEPHRFLNYITVDPAIRPEDLQSANGSRYYDLNDLSIFLMANDRSFNDSFLRNKVIVMGNFQTDIHKTAAGDMPGAMILANILISLCNKQNEVSAYWLVFLWGAFTLLSSLLLSGRPHLFTKRFNGVRKVMHQNLLTLIVGKGLLVTSLLLLVSIVSYFLFNRSVEIMGLLLWLGVASYVFGRWRTYQDKSKRPGTRKQWVEFFLLPLNK